MEKKLTIELVPHGVWHNNVRSAVSEEKWNQIRNLSYKLANHKCEICGDTGKNQGYGHNVECHEIWDYNEKTNLQKLVGFISLCPLCHKTKHIGLAEINGELDIVYKQLMKVNGMTDIEVEDYIEEEYNVWRRRNKLAWYTDISYVDKFLIDNDPIEAFMSKY